MRREIEPELRNGISGLKDDFTELILKYTEAAGISLSDEQAELCRRHIQLMLEWNCRLNLTRITDPDEIAVKHLLDSLLPAHILPRSGPALDIGTGAGFPGIPLKIAFPHLLVILIEVNNKKRAFLEHVIKKLGLTDVIIYSYDWRTFLRSTNYAIDYFFARASLQPDELARVFKPSCAYQKAGLVYWASQQWQPGKQEKPFIEKDISYDIEPGLKRRYIFFRKNVG